MWLDGLYMASPFMAQYGAEFNRPEWIDEAVKQLRFAVKHMMPEPVYHHAWDESKASVGPIRKPDILLISGA